MKSADSRPAGGKSSREGRSEHQHGESSGARQPEKKGGGWGSWMRERLRGSSRDRVDAEGGDRTEPRESGDRHRHVSEQRERPERGPSPVRHTADCGGGESGADRGRSDDGRRASGEASARHGGFGASPHVSAAARYPDDVKEWWYTDPKVGDQQIDCAYRLCIMRRLAVLCAHTRAVPPIMQHIHVGL